jgi:membrane-bound metal-dependent hydrolase YbcI (DUF457 family)
MMGRNHLLLGAAGYLGLEAAAPGLLNSHAPTAATLFAGALVCAGVALAPDIDHPQATVSRSLGPLSWLLSRGVHGVVGGHRKGTHTIWAWLAVSTLVWWALTTPAASWVALAVTAFASSLVLKVVTHADGVVCALLGVVFGGAAVLAAGADHGWLVGAVVLGYGLHLLGDIITTEGIPLLVPICGNLAIPIIGSTDHWREKTAGILCGVAAAYLLVTTVFMPAWQAQVASAHPAPRRVTVVGPAYGCRVKYGDERKFK